MEGWLFHLLKLNVIVSFVILLTVFRGKLWKSRYAAGWKYAVWLVLSLILLFPVKPFWEGAVTVKIGEVSDGEALPGKEAVLNSQALSEPEKNDPREVRLSGERISWHGALELLGPVWAAGILLSALYRSLQYGSSLKRIRRWSLPETHRDIKRLYRLECAKMRIAKPPVLLSVAHLESPLLAGLLRPTLYIPEKGYSPEELQLIFSHELHHYRSRDLWYKMLLMTVSVLYWFNPFLHLMRAEADKDIENLRDRNVIQGCGEPEKKAYQKLLLKTASMERDLTPHLAVSLNDSLLVSKDRIFYMRRAGQLKKGVLPAAALCLAVLLLNGAVGTAIEQEKEPEKPRTAALREEIRDSLKQSGNAFRDSASFVETDQPAGETVVRETLETAAAIRETVETIPAEAIIRETAETIPAESIIQETAETIPTESIIQETAQMSQTGQTASSQESENGAELYQRLYEEGGTLEGTVVSRDAGSITVQQDGGGTYTFSLDGTWTTVVAGEPGNHISLNYLGALEGSPIAQYASPSATQQQEEEGIKTLEGILTFEGNDLIGVQAADGNEYTFMAGAVSRPDFLTPGETLRIQYYGEPGSGEVVSVTRP